MECHDIAADDEVEDNVVKEEDVSEEKLSNIVQFSMAIESVTLDIFSGLKENGEVIISSK